MNHQTTIHPDRADAPFYYYVCTCGVASYPLPTWRDAEGAARVHVEEEGDS